MTTSPSVEVAVSLIFVGVIVGLIALYFVAEGKRRLKIGRLTRNSVQFTGAERINQEKPVLVEGTIKKHKDYGTIPAPFISKQCVYAFWSVFRKSFITLRYTSSGTGKEYVPFQIRNKSHNITVEPSKINNHFISEFKDNDDGEKQRVADYVIQEIGKKGLTEISGKKQLILQPNETISAVGYIQNADGDQNLTLTGGQNSFISDKSPRSLRLATYTGLYRIILGGSMLLGISALIIGSLLGIFLLGTIALWTLTLSAFLIIFGILSSICLRIFNYIF